MLTSRGLTATADHNGIRLQTIERVTLEVKFPGERRYLNMVPVAYEQVVGLAASRRPSNQLSNDRGRRQRTPADDRGQYAAAQSQDTKAGAPDSIP
jgi:hypothetical protein